MKRKYCSDFCWYPNCSCEIYCNKSGDLGDKLEASLAREEKNYRFGRDPTYQGSED